MFQKPEWKPWGLYVADAVYYGYTGDFEHAVKCHDLVAAYMREHPAERAELMPKGEIRYYDALWRAENPNNPAMQLKLKGVS